MKVHHGVIRSLFALILLFSSVHQSVGQYMPYKASLNELPSGSTILAVPLQEGVFNAEGDRSVAVDYCIPTYSSGASSNDHISLVKLGDIDNSTGASNSPYYTYYNNLTTSLSHGNSYTITLSAGTRSLGNNITVWIDYNQDGVFSADEKLGNATPGRKPTIAAINFTIPFDAIPGLTRMRVREVRNTSDMDPCNKHGDGETEDYNIKISNLSFTLSSTTTCLGSPSGTGTITAAGSGGVPPYTYCINSGSYQSSGLFTGLGTATYSITVKDAEGCTATQTIAVTDPPTSGDDQNMAGANSWVGHIYDGISFNNYVGNYAEPELFDQGFGGDTKCFNFISAGQTNSIYTETFSVRYRMNSTRKGLFVVDLGSDDGSRLTLDNTLIYDNWTPQSFSLRSHVLISLSGNSSLEYDFNEISGQNRVVFKNLVRILDNNLTNNISQSICLSGNGSAISGDALGTLPVGISKSGTGYQWVYSTSPGGTLIPIPGATGATYTPITSSAPFNLTGTYYVYRIVTLSSSNNVSPSPYVASHTSNAAVITVNPLLPSSVSITASLNPTCIGSSVTFTATPVNGGSNPSFQWKLNGNNVGTNSATFTTSSLTNGQKVACVMTSNAPCASGSPATSNAIVMSVGQEIGNNTLNLSSGVYGTVCGIADENATVLMNAPTGSVFVHVAFASYGTPNGSCNAFTYGACNSTSSLQVTETYILGNNSSAIPATNGVFGDPCVGTFKRLYVQAVYAKPICAGTSPGQITGTLPTGGTGTFTYRWESSTASSTSGFAAAPGVNNQQNYTPGNLIQTTWFRRTVYSGCESTSRVMVIYVTPAITNNTISAPQNIAAGETPAKLNGSAPAGGSGVFTYFWERSTTSSTTGFSACSGTNTGINYSPPALAQTTWFRRTVISGNCMDISATVQITISRLWKGTLSTDFATAGNWTNNSVPAPGDNIEFHPTPDRPCLLDGPRTVGNITNAQSAYRMVANGHTLTINGSLLFTNGAQMEAGSASSTLNFAGSAVQTIPAGAIYDNEVYNLTVNNPANVELQGTLNVKGVLLVTSGNLYTNNLLTLLSTADQTALIDGSGMGQVLGDVTMQRYLPKGFGYKYLSSPMEDATVAQLSDDMPSLTTDSIPAFYAYEENKISTGWNSYISPANPLLPLVGYCVNFGTNSDPKMIDITGKVNNDIVGPLSLHNHNRVYTKGFNLVGNPYPSPIDWTAAVGWSKNNIDDALYFFNAGDTYQYTGTYSSYINGFSSDGIANTSNIIPSMQGFFVHVSNGTYPVSGSLQVKNEARVNNLSPTFHKNAERDSRPLFRLNAKFEGTHSREDFLAIYFDYGATKRFEKELDALKIYNTDADVPNLFAISEDDHRLSIGAYLQPYDENLEIPLGIKTDKSGNVTLRLQLQENMPVGYNVYLKDKATGAVQDLSRVPVYSLPVGNGLIEGRLSLVFSSSDISQGSFGTNSFDVYANDGFLYVKIAMKETQASLRLTNMAGQVMLQQNIYGEGIHRLSSAPLPGAYLVTIFTDQGILSKKIYLQ